MKNVLLVLTFILLAASAQAGQVPCTGDALLFTEFAAPATQAEADYLGVPAGKPFTLDQVKGKYALIQVFSMYCPVCQRDAGHLNEVFAIIKQQGLESKVKIIAVGAGNSPFEVNIYRQKYQCPFPLLPDPDFRYHKDFGEPGTPYFWLVTLERKPRIIFDWKGEIQDADKFVSQMRKAGKF